MFQIINEQHLSYIKKKLLLKHDTIIICITKSLEKYIFLLYKFYF